ncbi:MAG: hypothetical protein IJN80_05315 [Clostridia bacterium]|nr:hypothetical protein [Clostridia bacterium]
MNEKKHLICRGKAAQGWVEGYYLPKHPTVPEIGPAIYGFEGDKVFCYPVDPKTVCACSGLQAKDERVLFDQDIILDKERGLAGVVEYAEEDGMFALMTKDGRQINFFEEPSSNFEIIGNAIDNPGFLEIV